MNPRLTAKDRGLIKGAVRRAFTRSELYREKLLLNQIEHSDPRNPRCKRWGWCEVCGWVQPQWKLQIDHIDPVVPLEVTFAEMSLDLLVDRMWCIIEGLQVICEDCHDRKTALERARKKELNGKRSNSKVDSSAA